ncbi:hypothetical protein ACN28C_02855 [Plantactinospora sp. WMMC1484]|uniref:hypothetical protein n=1 Tax=Plantactinospora sp. WMMC1484 TaxID=3404122 RepID=UPI003BF4822B
MPAEYVEHIARLIKDLDRRARPLAPPTRRDKPVVAPHGGEWPVDELRRFAQGRSRTHETVVAVLDLLSDRPGERLPVSEIAAELGSPVGKLIGALGGLTRIVKAYHDYQQWGLPVHRTCQSAPGRATVVYYGVSAEQARRWRLVRDGE